MAGVHEANRFYLIFLYLFVYLFFIFFLKATAAAATACRVDGGTTTVKTQKTKQKGPVSVTEGE